MTTPQTLPLQERVTVKNTLQRALTLLLTLLSHRLASLHTHGLVWLIAFFCESWFTFFFWILHVNAKWNLVMYNTYPDRLSKRFDDLPAVDMFVTTTDPQLEPPIITVNTVLSLLAVEYPVQKLACYLSDDGGSPLTFYSLLEASKFARIWVPFCKKYKIRIRAPFVYFSTQLDEASQALSSDFMRDWKHIKNEYEELSRKIEDAGRNCVPCHMKDEISDFSKFKRGNHPSIVKVIWENKGNMEDGFPHLIYVTREKRPKHSHHYKAGAMNVLKVGLGMGGIQGPLYGGTGCFHRRKIVYGSPPELGEIKGHDELSYEELQRVYGNSKELMESAAQMT